MSDFKDQLLTQIQTNIITTKEGKFLQAGAHQFQSFWTRDFCFASLGLSRAGEYEVVKNHLQRLLDSMNEVGLIPRILESSYSKKTVIVNTIFRFLPKALKRSKHNRELRSEHYGEHGTLSIDSNALVIIASFEYAKFSGDQEFITRNKTKLIQCYDFYQSRLAHGLVEQHEFEDWQDSAARSGKQFYTNLLYFEASKRMLAAELINIDLNVLKNKIVSEFQGVGLFVNKKDSAQVSVEANYLAILFDFVSESQKLGMLEKLGKAPFLKNLLPICTYPAYPKSEISWTCKSVGLSNYHDHMIWSWIIGLRLKTLKELGQSNDYEELLRDVRRMNSKQGNIFEVYEVETHKPVKRLFYRSESPFSWGIGIMLWAID